MTDYTKLIERMRTDAIFDNTTLGNESADAIEALQKEVSALDVLLEECKMDWSGDVTQLKAEHKHEIEALQAENERLSAGWNQANQEALQAKLTVQEQAKDIVLLCDDLKYIAGIARRAGMPVDDDNLKVRAAILGAFQILEAERDQLQSKLGDAIQSSAHWQHQCTELQVENERLKEEAKQWQSLSELSLGMAEAHSKERDALQAKLDAMDKGEPVGFVAPHELKDLSEGFPATVVMFRSNKRTVPLYAAPKALAPELVNCDTCVYHYKEADQKPCNTCVHARDFYDNFEPRVAKDTP